MTRLKLAFVPLILACAAPATGHDPAPSMASSAVVTAAARPAALVVDRFHAALRKGDTSLALALLTEDALIFEGGGVESGKAEYAAHHLGADAEFSAAVPSTRIRRWGRAAGPVAWIATESRTNGTFRGRQIVARNTETMILRRVGGSWKIAHIHWSSASAVE